MVSTSKGGSAGSAIPAGVDPQVWGALVEDPNTCVLVLGPEGSIEFANAAAACSLSGSVSSSLIGRRMGEFFDEDYVRERMDIVEDVLSTRRTVTLEGMSRGKYTRTSFRPLPGSDGAGRVLVVSRAAPPESEPAPGGGPVLRAKVNDAGKLGALTTRETEILKLIGMGLSTAEIAKKLHRSVKTIEWHRVSLGEKLGVTNRVELARIAIAAGLVGLDSPCPAPASPSDN